MLFKALNVAIVDDHALFRKALGNFLSEQKNVNVVIESPDILDLSGKLKTLSVDVLLMDIFLPGLSGAEAVRTIRRDFPDVKILILSMSIDMELVAGLLETGIHGYLSKADEPEDLLQAIQVASEGRIYRNRLLTEGLYWNRENNIGHLRHEHMVTLNEREKKILSLIWEEKSNKEIADELFLGVRSIEKIRLDLKEKIGAKSTVGLLKYAISKKIISSSLHNPV